VNFGYLALGEQAQTVDQSQIRHAKHLIWCAARDGAAPGTEVASVYNQHGKP
jgi:hypothetical protein